MSDIALPFRDRRHAGRMLDEKLMHYAGNASLLVQALPRGGVVHSPPDATGAVTRPTGEPR